MKKRSWIRSIRNVVTGLATFATLFAYQQANAQCNYSLFLYDSFGDGWNSSNLEVTYGSTTDTVTLPGGDTLEMLLLVSTGDTINLNFLGGGSFDSELSFALYNLEDSMLFYSDTTPTIGYNYGTTALCPTCPPPALPMVTNNVDDTVQLGWTEYATAVEWQIEYGPTGFSQGTGTFVSANSNPYDLTGLQPLSDFDFYVRSVCGPGDSSYWTSVASFTTLCGEFYAPYTDSVEDHTPTTSLTSSICWTTTPTTGYTWDITDDGETTSGSTGPTVAASGLQFFFTESSSGSTGDSAFLTSPYINIDSLASPTLQYDYHMFGATIGELIVEVFNGTTWITVAHYTGAQQSAQTDPWKHEIIDLSALSGGVYVRFTGIRGSSYTGDISVDNIEFIEAPSCWDPTNLSASNITDKVADLIWNENGSASQWEIQYDTVGFTPGTGNSVITNTNPRTLSGLQDNSIYEVYVRSICTPGDSSAWVGPITVATLCGTFNAPWIDSVENQLPSTSFTYYDCWESPAPTSYPWYITGSGTTTSSGTGAPSAHSGQQYFYTEGTGGSTGDTADLYSPTVNINPLTYPSLQFYYHMHGGDMDGIYVDVFDGAVWHDHVDSIMGEQQPVQSDPWKLKIVNLGAFSGAIQIRFRAIRGAGYESDICIDDIEIKDGPSCYAPHTVTASNITTDSALISWMYTDSASNWQISYGLSGIDPDSGTIVTTTGLTYQFDMLNSNTSYDAYVRLICGPGDTSAWSTSPASFTTECSFFTVPFVETFNTNSTTESCWEVNNNNGDADAWNMDYSVNEFEGDGVAMMYTDFNSGNNDDYLITPQIKLTGNERLKFQYRSQSTSEIIDYQVLISTNTSAPADFTDTLLVDTATSTTYAEHVIDISAFTGNAYIAFHVPPGSLDGWRLYIDYVVIEEIPTCFTPFALTHTDSLTTLDSAFVAWSDTGTATEWEVEYGPFGYTPGTGTAIASTDTSLWLTGLAHSTTYDVYVRAVCGPGDTSTWVIAPTTLTTVCGPVAAPYTDSVEAHVPTTALSQSNCWTAVDVSSSFSWDITDDGGTPSSSTGASTAASGLQYFYTEATSGGTGDTADLYSPEIIMTALTSPSLQFDYHMYGAAMGTLIVDVFDGTSWTNNLYVLDGPQQSAQADDWLHAIINLAGYGDTIQVRFRGIHGTSYTSDICVDNIEVINGPTCYDPMGLEVVNLLSTTGDLTWLVVDSAAEWQVSYDTMGFDPDTAVATTTTSSTFAMADLLPSSTYDAYVRSVCSPGDTSSWVGPITFTTLCPPYGVPFVETFNSTSATEDCWIVLNENGDGDSWNTNYTSNTLEGDQVAMMYTDFNSGNNDDYLISPAITVNGNQRLRFSYRAASTSEPNDYHVLVSTSTPEPTEFTNVLLVDTATSTTYAEHTLDLSSFTGNIYIAFHVPPGGLDGWRLYIDSVVVEDIPSCLEPSALTATALSDSSIEVTWTENGTAKNWMIEYDTTGFTKGTGMTQLTGSFPDTITGLNPNTEYEFYVRAICGSGDSSIWTASSITRTFCMVAPTPFIDSLESHSPSTNWTVSECWTNPNPTGYDWNIDGFGGTPTGSTGASSAYSGSNYFYTEGSDGSSGDTADLYTPEVDLTGLPWPSLQFHYHMYGSTMGNLYIEIYDTSWHTVDSLIGQQQASQSSAWLEKIVDLGNFSGVVKARFRAIKASSIYGDICLDDIKFTKGPSCYPPSNLTVLATGTDSVQLSWTEPKSATQWVIEYGATGFTPGTGTYTVANTIPFTVTGLNPSSDYDFYVMSFCGVGDTSSIIGPANANTLCAPEVAPWTEPFTNTTVPNCWTEAGDNAWEFGSGATGGFADYGASDVTDHTPGGGTSFIGMDGSNNGSGEVSDLITPYINVDSLDYPSLRFWMFSNNINDAALNEVEVFMYLDTGWILLDTISGNLDTTWVKQEYDLSGYNITGLVQFKFTVTGSSVGSAYYNDILFDDITVDEMYSCYATNLMVTETTHESVTLSWDENGSATDWDIEYGPSGFTPGSGTLTTVSGSPATIDGLSSSTSYDFYLGGNCGDSTNANTLTLKISDTTFVNGLVDNFTYKPEIYPNPASELVNMEFGLSESGRTVEVYSMKGELIISQNAENTRITVDTDLLAPGLYNIKISGIKGVSYHKLVIQ